MNLRNITKKLNEWTTQGHITAEQAERILHFESQKPQSSWVLAGLLILGAVIVGIGVISLIAANWAEIPAVVKLGVDFVLLFAVAFAVFKSWEANKSIQFEVLLLFFLLLCLASIGLISQIYHTGGKLHQAVLFWSLIVMPTTWAARYFFVHFVWSGAFVLSLSFTLFDSRYFEIVFKNDYFPVTVLIPLVCVLVTVLSKKVVGEESPTRAFRIWTVFAGLVSLPVIEVFSRIRDYEVTSLVPFIPAYIFASLAGLAIWRVSGDRKSQKILLLGTLGLFLLASHLRYLHISYMTLHAAVTILILGLLAVYFASLGKRALFQFFLILIGLRFLVIYFQALGDLATTGIGLIISGCLVIGVAILWHSYRAALADWAERTLR